MAKHLPPRGSALPPWRASLLPALMWLILLTIFPARLHAQEITVNEKSIVVPVGMQVSLGMMMENKVVEGVPGNSDDYNIVSSVSSEDIRCSNYGTFYIDAPLTTTMTFTNKEDSSISFSIEFTATKPDPGKYIIGQLNIYSNYRSIFIGYPKTISVPDDYFPLSKFDIKFSPEFDYPTADATVKVDGNDITLTGVSQGQAALQFVTKYGMIGYPIGIIPKPSVDDIIVNEPSIKVPTSTTFSLKTLIEQKVVEGLPGHFTQYSNPNDNYNVESSVSSDDIRINPYGFISIYDPLTTTLTFTNKDFSDVKFSVEVTAAPSPANYVNSNLGTVYVGESKSITIPDEYLSLSEFTLEKGDSNDNPDTDFSVATEGNKLTVTGVTAGKGYLVFKNRFGNSDAAITIANKPSADDVVLNEKSIVVATNGWIDLQSLINNKVVEGIPGSNSDYSVILSNTDIAGSQQDGTFYFLQPGTATVTFTNKEFNDISFSIEVTAKYSPSNCITSEYETLYIGDSKTITVPEDYLPLSEFTITKWLYSGYPDADFDFDVNGNSLTLTGVAEGKRGISFRYRFGEVSNVITIANKPSAGDIEVKEKSITIPTNVMIYFRNLIENGIVEGVPGTYSDYSITYSDNTTGVLVDDGPCGFRMSQPGTATITYTHKEFPDVKFSIEVTAKYAPYSYINGNLGTVYVGESKTITIPDSYVPLSDYTLEKSTYSDCPDTDFDFTVDGNKITFTGVTEGVAQLVFNGRFGTSSSQITIAPKPSADNIKVNVSSLTYPVSNLFYLSYLIKDKVVEGLTGSDADYTVEASDPNIISKSGNAIYFRSPGTTTLTYTNKEFSDISFSIEVTAKYNPATYISSKFSNRGSAYVGESTTIVLPDDYIPFSNFDIEKRIYSEGADCEYSVDGSSLTVTGIADGTVLLRLYDKVLKSIWFGGQIIIKTREVAVEVNEEGEATAGSQLGVPVTVALPEDINLSVDEGEKIVWESEDEEIASVDPVTGEITPLKLGKTTITVKKMPENQTYALKSRAGDEETLVTIVFWVTELELAEEMNLDAGSSEQLTYNVNAGDETYPYDIKPRWTSSNTAVAKVSSNGTVTAVSEGSAVITLSTSIGTKQTIVNVEPDNTPAGSLSINPSDVTLTVGSRLSLSTKGADGKKVIWRTSDSFVAQIDENGVITGIASGTAIITATIEGTSTQATTRVTVFERTTGIEETEASEPVITVDNMTISVSGIDSDLPVEIYNVSGRLIASRKGSCSVAVGQTGIYIVRTGATARKVAVKH